MLLRISTVEYLIRQPVAQGLEQAAERLVGVETPDRVSRKGQRA
jgi:hypothetical protein